eukprot:TRINITY_DN2154_c0_g1_i2.p1 TRINITY_DN2154_c0_g1~~TRINITY_DN2154_c0_g1_i2.p1  ORF type:complete len:229 (-),score=5.79 TRINITY_DN2154_c0_g1_i2:1096-1782(-)
MQKNTDVADTSKKKKVAEKVVDDKSSKLKSKADSAKDTTKKTSKIDSAKADSAKVAVKAHETDKNTNTHKDKDHKDKDHKDKDHKDKDHKDKDHKDTQSKDRESKKENTSKKSVGTKSDNKKHKGKLIFSPTDAVSKAAAHGLELHKKFHKGGTEVGIGMAKRLKAKDEFNEKEIKKMYSYFARHAVDKKSAHFGDESNPSKGYIAWLLWGGDEGQKWVSAIKKKEHL